ncbi:MULTISPECIES: hypothetical protein [Bradyrhizobium]|jgi:hypothetical protein|nr:MULTISPECIES: hypothetical protein [Bradyrhizobium]
MGDNLAPSGVARLPGHLLSGAANAERISLHEGPFGWVIAIT